MEDKKTTVSRRRRFLRTKTETTDHHKDLVGLKMLVTVVNRNKADFYVDFLHQYEVNQYF